MHSVATPPSGSGFVTQTQSGLSFTTNAELNVILISADTPTYAGRLVDRSGAGVPNHEIVLFDDEFSYRDTTDGSGAFAVSASSALPIIRFMCQLFAPPFTCAVTPPEP